jgi:hypothetical protein
MPGQPLLRDKCCDFLVGEQAHWELEDIRCESLQNQRSGFLAVAGVLDAKLVDFTQTNTSADPLAREVCWQEIGFSEDRRQIFTRCLTPSAGPWRNRWLVQNLNSRLRNYFTQRRRPLPLRSARGHRAKRRWFKRNAASQV